MPVDAKWPGAPPMRSQWRSAESGVKAAPGCGCFCGDVVRSGRASAVVSPRFCWVGVVGAIGSPSGRSVGHRRWVGRCCRPASSSVVVSILYVPGWASGEEWGGGSGAAAIVSGWGGRGGGPGTIAGGDGGAGPAAGLVLGCPTTNKSSSSSSSSSLATWWGACRCCSSSESMSMMTLCWARHAWAALGP